MDHGGSAATRLDDSRQADRMREVDDLQRAENLTCLNVIPVRLLVTLVSWHS